MKDPGQARDRRPGYSQPRHRCRRPEATFGRLEGVLRGGVKLEVRHLCVEADTTIAELLSTSVTSEGAPFANRYCWVCRFDGDTIVEVRAYLDSLTMPLRNHAK